MEKIDVASLIIQEEVGTAAWGWVQPLLYIPGGNWDSFKPVIFIKLPPQGSYSLIEAEPAVHIKSATLSYKGVALCLILLKLGSNPYIYETWVNHYSLDELGSPLSDWQRGKTLYLFCMEESPKPERIISVQSSLDFVPALEFLKKHPACSMEAFTEAKISFPYSVEELWQTF